ncbi:MAG: sulfite exporter TauE/SafE family protein, partial [Chloroflexota bacterium]
MIFLQFALIGLLIGLLIGSVGVGGILLAPLLAYLTGMNLHLAIATSVWSFLFTGITGTLSYARKGTISWRMVGWISLGIIPGTILGARTNLALSITILTVLLASLIILSGLNTLYKRPVTANKKTELTNYWLILIGLAVGFGSALIGAGGAVFLVPTFLFLNIPPLVAIGVSQAVQLPVAIFGS